MWSFSRHSGRHVHICRYLGSTVAAESGSSIRRQLAGLQGQMRFVLFSAGSGDVPPLAVMSVRQERCLAQASVADL